MDTTASSTKPLAQPLAPLTQPVRRLVDGLVDGTVGLVLRWPVESQQRARRNALVASTALARRRAERLEVEELLAVIGSSRADRPAGDSYLPGAHHG